METISIKEYLNKKGIKFRESNKELITRCIFNSCDDNSKGNEAHLYFSAETSQYECKKCGAKGNIFTLAKHLGDEIKDIALKPFSPSHCQGSNEQKLIDINLVESCHRAIPARIQAYLNARGITDTLIDQYKLGWGQFYGQWWITIPIKNQTGDYYFLKLRQDPNVGKEKMTYPKNGAHAQLYDWETLKTSPEKIVICEGELDRLLLTSKGIPAVTSTHGAATFKDDWVESLASIKQVYVCFDNDTAGRRGAKNVLSKLFSRNRHQLYTITLPEELGEGGDITDYFIKHKGNEVDLFNKLAKEYIALDNNESTPNKSSKEALVVRFSDIQSEQISWLWQGRFALGKLTLIVGDPCLGKSLLTATLAAIVSRGYPFPVDKTKAPQGDVILLSAEDDAADTTKPRLEAAEADCERIHVLKAVQTINNEGEQVQRMFSLKSDLVILEKLLPSLPNCRLIIVDPISAYLDGTESHNNSDVRGLLAPLSALAARYKIAIIAVSHLNKGYGGNALYRTMGSLAFVAAARAAYVVTKDEHNPERRLFLPVKNNLAKDNTGLAYSVMTAPNGAPMIAWETEPVSITADEALAPVGQDEEHTATDEAVDFLRDILSEGAMKASEVQKEARQAGYSEKSLRRAREKLGIKPKKSTFSGGWQWSLVEDAQDNQDDHPIDEGTLDDMGHLQNQNNLLFDES